MNKRDEPGYYESRIKFFIDRLDAGKGFDLQNIWNNAAYWVTVGRNTTEEQYYIDLVNEYDRRRGL